jgi:ATP-dependent exoDNAse (exonuclease V) alpha subunit
LNDYKTGQTKLQKTQSTQVFYNTLIVIDEASMIDSELLKIIRQQTMNCKILYIGDSAQLAPIFETASPVFTSVKDKLELTTIQRQQEHNPIIALSQQMRNSVESDSFSEILSNGLQIQHLSGEDFQQEINNTFTHNYSVDSAKILAWTNTKVLQYNEYVHTLIHNTSDILVGDVLVTNNPILGVGGMTVHSTDSLVTVGSITPTTEKGIAGNWIRIKESRIQVFVANNLHEVTALLKQLSKNKLWVEYFAAKDFFADLRNIYSSTVHKSQGSTYGTVFIDLTDIGSNNKSNEVARLLYVAITRASDKVVFYGKLPDKYCKGLPSLEL